MTGYNFHQDAAIDLDEIWDFIAEDNLEAADKVAQVRSGHMGKTGRPVYPRQLL